MEQVSWHEERGSGVKWAELPVPRRMAKGVREKSLRPWRLASRSPSPLSRIRVLGLNCATTHSRRMAKGVREKSLRPWRLASRSPSPLSRIRVLGLNCATTHSRRMAKGVREKSLRPWRLASLPLASFALPGVGVKLRVITHS